MSTDRSCDLVLFGATGFTGQLVAGHLWRTRADDSAPLKWAVAGRRADRLRALCAALGAGPALPHQVVDAADAGALRALVAQTASVVSTVGPYSRHGEALALACAEAGTDYLDLCGEPLWMARMIPRLQPLAADSGARIVFSCGFDSIPFDLGVVFLQDAAMRRFGQPLRQVQARVRVMKGSFSGGTAASLLATLEDIAADPSLSRTMADPFALTAEVPGFRGPPQPDPDRGADCDEDHGWTAPFVMAAINTKNVHRTNALRGHPWGRDFVYDERMATGLGVRGERRARALTRQAVWQQRALGFAPARALIRRFVLPKPGQGPDAAEREAGCYEIGLSGRTQDGHALAATVRGERDPGYGSTSRLIVEAARCLRSDVNRVMTPGGVWTPGAAMGLALVERLQARAGLRFTLDG